MQLSATLRGINVVILDVTCLPVVLIQCMCPPQSYNRKRQNKIKTSTHEFVFLINVLFDCDSKAHAIFAVCMLMDLFVWWREYWSLKTTKRVHAFKT